MRIIKFISLGLLAAFSILLVHDMVPHHHQMEAMAHAASLDCPKDHHDPAHKHDHEKEERHCHAFNDISFLKYNASGIPRPVKLVFDHAVPVPGDDSRPEAFRVTSLFLCQKIPIQDPGTRGLHLMRAPPLL